MADEGHGREKKTKTGCATGVTMRRGQNPRQVLRRHAERGPQRYWYDYDAVATLTGYTVQTVKQKAYNGELDMNDLRSVALFVLFNRHGLGSTDEIVRFAKTYLSAAPLGMGITDRVTIPTIKNRRRAKGRE